MNLLRMILLTGLIGVATAASEAQLALSQDFDSGSLNVGSSTINVSNPAQQLITLAPRRTWNNQHWWVSFTLDNANATRPRFEIGTSGAFQAYKSAHRYMYSYDGENWSFFNNAGITNGKYWFENTAGFTSNKVHIAYGLPYSMAKVDAWVADLKTSPFVTPTASADSDLVIGRTPGTANGGYLDDSGRTVAQQNLYGFRISDDTYAGPKLKIVLLGGNHSGESTANHVLQGMVDFLRGNDPVASRLRRGAEFFVYPEADPEGRAAGYYRSTPAKPSENHNRIWDNPTGVASLQALQAAMRADTGADIDYFFDFHSYGTPTDYKLNLDAADTTSTYVLALRKINDISLDTAVTGAGNARAWAQKSTTLNADFSFTPEVGFITGWQAPQYHQLGQDYALALADVVVVPEPGAVSAIFIGAVTLLSRRVRHE